MAPTDDEAREQSRGWVERHRGSLSLLLLAAFLLGAAVWVARLPDTRPLIIATATPPATRAPKAIKVHVSGAVLRPGVYTFVEGARVEDALAAAGGPAEEADLDRINLALRLRDEQQVYVPRQAAPGTAEVGETASAPGVATPGGTINLNVASRSELEALPGIGEVTARRIVEHRERYGPFPTLEEFKRARLVRSDVYERIKDRLTVQ